VQQLKVLLNPWSAPGFGDDVINRRLGQVGRQRLTAPAADAALAGEESRLVPEMAGRDRWARTMAPLTAAIPAFLAWYPPIEAI
jgi:hypothetical protein